MYLFILLKYEELLQEMLSNLITFVCGDEGL